MKKLIILIGLAVFFCGCASRLETYNSQKEPTKGIPFATPVLVKITEKTTYELVAGEDTSYQKYCTPEIDIKHQILAVGEQGYITFDPAQFGKGEFKVEFNDAGLLKSVSLNSDATAAAANVSSLLEALLPYIAAPIAGREDRTLAPQDTAQRLKETHCLKKGTEVIGIERFLLK